MHSDVSSNGNGNRRGCNIGDNSGSGSTLFEAATEAAVTLSSGISGNLPPPLGSGVGVGLSRAGLDIPPAAAGVASHAALQVAVSQELWEVDDGSRGLPLLAQLVYTHSLRCFCFIANFQTNTTLNASTASIIELERSQ